MKMKIVSDGNIEALRSLADVIETEESVKCTLDQALSRIVDHYVNHLGLDRSKLTKINVTPKINSKT